MLPHRLPRIQAKVDTALHAARIELSKIAPLTANSNQEINKLFSSFFRDLSNHLAGRSPEALVDADQLPFEAGLWNRLHVNYEVFRKRIQDTAPQFRPWRSTIKGSESDELQKELLKIDASTTDKSPKIMYADEVLALAKRRVQPEPSQAFVLTSVVC